MTKVKINSNQISSKSTQSTLEHKLIADYLLSKGYTLSDLEKLPKQEAKNLMGKACLFASLKLAEIESRSIFRQKIEGPE
ncbi:hypothetical protein ACFLV7_10535 [Chloroflexota bacterium]